MRAVLDVNVLISALLSRSGAPARVVLAWQQGAFELVVSPALLDEFARALAYPKVRRFVAQEDAEGAVAWIARSATLAIDPAAPPAIRSTDPGDDYPMALAAAERAILVSGDRHVLEVAGGLPIYSPASFLLLLEQDGTS